MKARLTIDFLSNTRKHNVMFVVIPTIGILTGLYNHKTKYILTFAWLYLEISLIIRHEK